MDETNCDGRLISSVPTAAGGIARAAYTRVAGSPPQAALLASRAGLTISQLKDPHVRIGVHKQIKFLDLIADAVLDEFLGFHLACEVDLRELGLLYYVQASSDTLGDAFRRVVRYCSIQNEGVAIAYGCGNSASIRFEYRGVRRLNDRHQVEFFVAAAIRLWRQLTGRHLIPNCVKMAHRRVEVHAEVRTFFGCNVLFGGDIDSIEFPASVALLPLVAADEYLNRLLVKYCDETLSKRRLVAKSWRLAVENALAPLLPHGQGTVSEVSNRLAVSERTLARRLADEGATFHDVLDNLRFELAKRYLEEPQFPVTEIAWLLGYGNPTAFTHAFRRWTGRPPSKYASYHNCIVG